MDVFHGVYLNTGADGICPWLSSNATGPLTPHGKQEGLLRKLYRRVSIASLIDLRAGEG